MSHAAAADDGSCSIRVMSAPQTLRQSPPCSPILCLCQAFYQLLGGTSKFCISVFLCVQFLKDADKLWPSSEIFILFCFLDWMNKFTAVQHNDIQFNNPARGLTCSVLTIFIFIFFEVSIQLDGNFYIVISLFCSTGSEAAAAWVSTSKSDVLMSDGSVALKILTAS